MIGIINSICVVIFEQVPVYFEKCLTYAEETLAQFNRIFVIQFLNIGCLLLFADLTYGNTSNDTDFPLFVGHYRDFDTKWYYDIGAKICLAMISNSVIGPFMSKAFKPFIIIIVNRWWLDRCCKKHLRKINNIRDEE